MELPSGLWHDGLGVAREVVVKRLHAMIEPAPGDGSTVTRVVTPPLAHEP